MRGQEGKSDIVIGEYALKEDIIKAISSIALEAAAERENCTSCKDPTCGNQMGGVAEADGQLSATLRISARLGIDLVDVIEATPDVV